MRDQICFGHLLVVPDLEIELWPAQEAHDGGRITMFVRQNCPRVVRVADVNPESHRELGELGKRPPE